ncbi:cupin domain-containing protein [Streptomyces sp. NPDC058442]|uniref:cupin domain-containing protein n=1 Tax=Streptomyces sp. NPDC058442 TaxID=3346503 RepID=UPI00365F3268
MTADGDDATEHDGDLPLPRTLCDTAALAALEDAPAGALWRLAEPGRQLDANVVRIPPGRRVDTHREPDLDVLLLVLAGEGSLTAPDGTRPLRAGTLIWLPHGSTRSLAADDEGLTCLTVHRRRPGLRIAPPGATGPSDGPPRQR